MRRALIGFALYACAIIAGAQEDPRGTRLGVTAGGVAGRSSEASGGKLALLHQLSAHWDLDAGAGSVRDLREEWPHSTVGYDFTSLHLGVRLWSEEDRRTRLFVRVGNAAAGVSAGRRQPPRLRLPLQ